MKQISIRRFSLIYLLITLCIVAALGVISFINIKEIALEQVYKQQIQELKVKAQGVSHSVDFYREIVRQLSIQNKVQNLILFAGFQESQNWAIITQKLLPESIGLALFDERGKIEVGRFSFPRQQKDDGLCIADFFHDVASNERDVVGLQVVTVGSRASEVEKQLMENDQYQDYLFLHGLAVELAEAMAEYVHKRIRSDLGFANKDADDIKKMIKQGYQGCRYSFGYPACPNISDQRLLLGLLRADRIGIKILENDMLEPEQSTSAFIAHHPQAKYFNV